MYILGISNSMDSNVALLKDGELIFAAGEERFSRVKQDDSFPQRALDAALLFAGIALDDIDVVAYGWHKGFPEEHLKAYVQRCIDIEATGKEAKDIMDQRIQIEAERSLARRADFDRRMEELGLSDRVEYFDHHVSHAATAYYPSPFEEALVITLDAAGDYRSGTVSVGKGNSLTEVSCNFTFDGLGFLYGQITELLGFKPHRHEGKVTGLAAFGDPKPCLPIMQKMVEVKDGKIYGLLHEYFKPFFYEQKESLKAALKPHTREEIAAALQKHLEDVVTEYILYYVQKHEIGNIACSGGIFANVKMNQRIRALKGVTDLYVFPQMNDGGLAVGAAILSSLQHGEFRKRPTSMYLGPASTNEEVEQIAKKYGDKVTLTAFSHDDLVMKTVELIEKNTVVGLFQGRMEYGPRALGNRTVLYHAKDRSVNDWLNTRLRRTEFMPFAPVTTMELAPQCFLGWNPSHVTTKWMTECYDVTEELKTNAPAIVHVDGTARPQIIAREDNPFYYDVITAWHKKTGGLCLINTSFNEHEEPIVCTIEDAVESMLGDNVDCLVVNGKYLINKR
ncbi:MAG TPA: carbamoyltransferase C-terminal domain-containing protein [Candidatus Peribacterales bacterium]|nr:carbamoyltransferase C-terminal domain-containing protein [Candidatus Peribacterales bacterium]